MPTYEYKTQDEAIKETTARYVTAHNDFAVKHGLNEAILFDKLVRLQDNLKGAIDDAGNKWIRMQNTDWQTELPFWVGRTIQRIIESCEATKGDKEPLIYSRTFTGRCKWYRINPTYRHNTTGQDVQLQHDNLSSPSGQVVQLPNSSPNSLPNTIITTTAAPKNLKVINTEKEADAVLIALTTNYEDCISVTISQILSDEFKDYSWQVKPDWVVNAFKATVSANVQNWNYPRAILDECIKAGAWKSKVKEKQNGHQQRERQFNGSAAAQPERKRSGGADDRARAIAQRSR